MFILDRNANVLSKKSRIHLRTKDNHEYVLVISDHFICYIRAFATKNKSAKSVAKKYTITKYFFYGFVKQIHDSGKEFNNTLFKKLYQLCRIKASSKTTLYYPTVNRQTEKMKRTIICMIITLYENQKSKWKDHLLKLAFSYNRTTDKSAGYSPYFLILRWSSRLPIDSFFDVNIDINNERSYDQFVSDWEN